MKEFSIEIEVDVPRSVFVEMFIQPENMTHRLENFSRFEVVSGSVGHEGAELRIFHKIGGREISYMERVERAELPYEITTQFIANGGSGWTRHKFIEISENRMKWVLEDKHKTKGMVRLIEFFAANMMRDTAWREMEMFKRFVEHEATGA